MTSRELASSCRGGTPGAAEVRARRLEPVAVHVAQRGLEPPLDGPGDLVLRYEHRDDNLDVIVLPWQVAQCPPVQVDGEPVPDGATGSPVASMSMPEASMSTWPRGSRRTAKTSPGDAETVRDTSMRIGLCSAPVILRVWHRRPRRICQPSSSAATVREGRSGRQAVVVLVDLLGLSPSGVPVPGAGVVPRGAKGLDVRGWVWLQALQHVLGEAS